MVIVYLVKISYVISTFKLAKEFQMDINTFYTRFLFVLVDILFKTDTLMETQNLFVYEHSKNLYYCTMYEKEKARLTKNL